MSPALRSRLESIAIHYSLPIVGGVLLVAAVLKLQALVINGANGAGAFYSAVLIIGELLLGSFLCLYRPHRIVVVATASLFVGFAIYGAYLLTIGRPSCTCFGALSGGVWQSLFIDAACVALLASSLVLVPACSWTNTFGRPALRLSLQTLGIGAIAAGVLVAADSLPIVARWRGEAVRIHVSSLKDVKAQVGEERVVNMKVTNKWREPVRLVGGTFGCTCNGTRDIPMDIPPGETRTLRLVVAPLRTPGRFNIPIALFTNVPWQYEVNGVLDLNVEESPSGSLASFLAQENRNVGEKHHR